MIRDKILVTYLSSSFSMFSLMSAFEACLSILVMGMILTSLYTSLGSYRHMLSVMHMYFQVMCFVLHPGILTQPKYILYH